MALLMCSTAPLLPMASSRTLSRRRRATTVPVLSTVMTGLLRDSSLTTADSTRTTLSPDMSLVSVFVSLIPCPIQRKGLISRPAYTTFAYSDITVNSTVTAGPTTGAIASGGAKDLFDTVATVTAKITNNGTVAGAEVAQLYIGLPATAPSAPPKQLRGFAKLPLEKGASGTATFPLRRKDLSYWDVGKQQWVVPTGEFKIYVGSSSRDIRLTDKITV